MPFERDILPFEEDFQAADVWIRIKSNSPDLLKGSEEWLWGLPRHIARSRKRITLSLVIDYRGLTYQGLSQRFQGFPGEGLNTDGGIIKFKGTQIMWRELTDKDPSIALIDIRRGGCIFVTPCLRFKSYPASIPIPYRLIINSLLWGIKRILLHASCVTKDGIGILIPGPAGAGKTVLALYYVLRRDFYLVSDDRVFLTDIGGRIEAIGIPQHMGIHKSTLRIFPELRCKLKRKVRDVAYLDPRKVFGEKFRERARITHILVKVPSYRVGNPSILGKFKIWHALLSNTAIISCKPIMDERLGLLSRLASSTKALYISRYKERHLGIKFGCPG